MRWARGRSRHNGSPTDTQTDTQTRNPRQGVSNHCLMSWRRHCEEEVTIVTVLTVARAAFLKLKQKSRAPQRKPPVPRTDPKYRWVGHHTRITHPPIPYRWVTNRNQTISLKPHTHPSHKTGNMSGYEWTIVSFSALTALAFHFNFFSSSKVFEREPRPTKPYRHSPQTWNQRSTVPSSRLQLYVSIWMLMGHLSLQKHILTHHTRKHFVY
jgi:hypothetical protein